MEQLSVAIIGAGDIAGGYDEKKRHGDDGVYSHAGAYAKHGGFTLRTVCDMDNVRAENFCCTWKASAPFASLDEICVRFHDVVSVCTPDHTHFGIVRDILAAGCCRTVFVEKPLGNEPSQIEELIRLAKEKNIHLVVNFQRRVESQHREIRDVIQSSPDNLLSATGCYMKGLRHIGVTMIDTLCYIFGYPDAVLAFNRVFNHETEDFSYEFVLFYPRFTVAVKTTDAERFYYNYHIFEIDLLLRDRRWALVNISQGLRESPVTPYSYSEVKIINDREAQYRETSYKSSMLDTVGYIHDITKGRLPHVVNTPQSSWNNLQIISRIIESYEGGSVKIHFEHELWKR